VPQRVKEHPDAMTGEIFACFLSYFPNDAFQRPGNAPVKAFAQNDALGASNLVYSRSLMMRHLRLAKTNAPASKPKKK
jgi:hypothetical protein